MRWALMLVLPFMWVTAEAQIYRCTAPDGTPIFSDQRCGPDAKIVPGITTRKPTPPAAANTPRPEPKSPQELKALLERCNQGDNDACSTWTRSGGPNQLREEERQHELACEAGSLRDCEQRYCLDGVTEECRRRVFLTAKLSGESWYLHEQRTLSDGGTSYAIRCAPPGSSQMRDVTVTCSAIAGPQRCSSSVSAQAFARLDQAAQASCQRASASATR